MLGDHIRALKDGRWLHGIDLGDQRVLFLAEQPGLAPGDRLRRVYRPEFTAGAARVELVVHRERTYPAKAVVARAWSRFMDPSVVAMFGDSEQFAAWCKIGRAPELGPPAAPPAAATARRKAPPKAKAAVKAAAAKPRKAAAKAKAGAARRPVRKPAGKAARKAAPRKAARKVKAAARARPVPKRKAAKRKARR
jgi:hypothetical protein